MFTQTSSEERIPVIVEGGKITWEVNDGDARFQITLDGQTSNPAEMFTGYLMFEDEESPSGWDVQEISHIAAAALAKSHKLLLLH